MKRSRILKSAALLLCLGFSMTSIFGCSSRNSTSEEIKVRHKEIEETEETTRAPEPTETEPEPEPIDTPIPTETETEPTEVDNSNVINVFCYSSEIVEMCELYKSMHPDCDYEFQYTQIASSEGAYQMALEAAVRADDSNSPDIFVVEEDYADKYINGALSEYIAGYDELGIDIDVEVKDAGIAQFVVDQGTRESDGKIVALAYQSYAGVMIYRTDIAEEVFGTSDPDEISEICGGNSGSLTKLLAAGDKLVAKDYALTSGLNDMWFIYDAQDPSSWYKNGDVYISNEHESFFDFADTLYANSYTNKNPYWTNEWFDDMNGTSDRATFAYFAPAWLIDFSMSSMAPGTTGLWNITDSPVNFTYGNLMLLTTKQAAEADDGKKAVIADFLNWAFIDTTTDGWQYQFATGYLNGFCQPCTSSVVMEQVTMYSDYLGGQDMAPIFNRANENTKAGVLNNDNLTIGASFVGHVKDYADGVCTKTKAEESFLGSISEYLKS